MPQRKDRRGRRELPNEIGVPRGRGAGIGDRIERRHTIAALPADGREPPRDVENVGADRQAPYSSLTVNP